MNPHHKDTVYTITVAVGGFVAQMTNLDLLLKVLIGAAAFVFILFRAFVFVLKNWDAFRSPVKFMKEYRRRRKHKKAADDEESTTV